MIAKRMAMVGASVVIAGTIAACCFNPSSLGQLTPIELAPGFQPDPYLVSGIAGGANPASSLQSSCSGYMAFMPSHIVNVNSPMMLRVLVHSDQDTTLIVRLENGTVLCNDDGEGNDPVVEYAFPQGAHTIFVGTYTQNTQANYTLGITTNPRVTPSTMQGGSPPAVVDPGAPSPSGPTGTVLRTGTATVAVVTGQLPGVTQGTTCNYAQMVADPARNLCRWRVECAGLVVYGDGEGGYAPCSDPAWPSGTLVADTNTQSGDNDPSLVINAGGMTVRDDRAGPRGEYSLTATLAQ
jgi:hypothetical protein